MDKESDTPTTDGSTFTIIGYPHPTEPFGEITMERGKGRGLVEADLARKFERAIRDCIELVTPPVTDTEREILNILTEALKP